MLIMESRRIVGSSDRRLVNSLASMACHSRRSNSSWDQALARPRRGARATRGCAPAGLAGIAARGRGGLVRPLLPFTRRELDLYATERGLPVHDDPANRAPRHLRSWIRTTLLPLLNERMGARLRRSEEHTSEL